MQYQDFVGKYPQLVNLLISRATELYLLDSIKGTDEDELPKDLSKRLQCQVQAQQLIQASIQDLILDHPLTYAKLNYWDNKLNYSLKPFLAAGLRIRVHADKSLVLNPSTEHAECKKRISDWLYLSAGDSRDALYMPYLEPCLEQIDDLNWITLNAYQSTILNSRNLPILDIDYCKYGDKGYKTEQELLSAVPKVLDIFKYSGRLYKTKQGYRYIVNDRTFNAESWGCLGFCRELGVDPLYAKLCLKQKCYRARITPKPWRYEERVCTLIQEFKYYKPLPELQKLIALHDHYTLHTIY